MSCLRMLRKIFVETRPCKQTSVSNVRPQSFLRRNGSLIGSTLYIDDNWPKDRGNDRSRLKYSARIEKVISNRCHGTFAAVFRQISGCFSDFFCQKGGKPYFCSPKKLWIHRLIEECPMGYLRQQSGRPDSLSGAAVLKTGREDRQELTEEWQSGRPDSYRERRS